MSLLIESSSYENDIIWEPFGGLFSASLAAFGLCRKAFASEIHADVFNTACQRFVSESVLENIFEYA
jgi:site-specific DNA-methyltransferase (adenine-specific)